MQQIIENNGVKHTINTSAISLDKIYKNEFQKEGTLTAQIRQTVTTVSSYPSKRVGSDMQENLFSADDFNFQAQEFTSTETRVAWILIPVATTEAEVLAKLATANANKAVIYKVLSNAPILDENQKYAITQGFKTKDEFANSQAVRYGTGHESEGQLTLDKAGNVQYRRTFFWNSPIEDQDNRGVGEIYLSAELKAELAGASVMMGQSL